MFRTENLTFLVEQIHKTSRTNKDIKHIEFLHGCFLVEYPVVEAAMDAAINALKKNLSDGDR